MSENSKIEWTDHTFNPWSGCTKISAGCQNCYAAGAMPSARRFSVWGDKGTRVPASDDYWKLPARWNRAAEKDGVRRKVFCASMADVFEDREGLDVWRSRLFSLIRETPHLDWQLLTKRPEVALRFWQNMSESQGDSLPVWTWPDNAWIGTSVENQEAADTRIPILLKIPAKVRFLSCEPLLGSLDVEFWLADASDEVADGPFHQATQEDVTMARGIQWVIVGGESGSKARPMHPDWARSLRDQCVAAGVPYFFKQWGEWAPWLNEAHFTHGDKEKHPHAWVDGKTGDHGHAWLTDGDGLWSNWTGDPRGHDSPPNIDGESTLAPEIKVMGRVGKSVAGRELDGRTWDQVPE